MLDLSCVVVVCAERRFGSPPGKLASPTDLICVRASRIPCPAETKVTGSDSEAVLASRAPTGRERSRALGPRSCRTIWAPSGAIEAGGTTRASGRKTSGPLNDTADSGTEAASAEDATAARADASVSAGS